MSRLTLYVALAATGIVGCDRDTTTEPTPLPPPAFSTHASAALPTIAATILFGGVGDQHGIAIAVNAGDIYAAGYTQVGGLHGLLLKFGTPPEDPLWNVIEPGLGFAKLALQNGVTYSVGWAVPPACGASDGVGDTEGKSYLARYDADGSRLGCRSENYFPYRGGEGYSAVLGATVGGTPFIFAAGGAEQVGFARSSPFVFARYSASGTLEAAVTEPGITLGTYGGCCPGESNVFGLVELGGHLYLAGHSRLPGHGEDNVRRPVLMRYDPTSLARIWKARPTDNAGGIFWAVAPYGGDLVVVGENGPSGSRDYLVERYTAAGGRVWSVSSGGAGDDALRGIVNVGGRLFAVGHTSSSGTGGADGVVLEIDPLTGATLTTTHLGAVLDDFARDVATDGTHLYVVGESRSYATEAGNEVGQSDLALWHLQLNLDIEVAIDIKPGSDPNAIACNVPNEIIPAAILTTDEFDATTVDHTTVAFGPDGATESHANRRGVVRHETDVDGDGDIDLVLHFRNGETGIQCGDTDASLTGETFGGTSITGQDAIRTVP